MFRYGDKVKIKEGFYKNCFGILTDVEVSKDISGKTAVIFKDVYEVEIRSIDKSNCYRNKTIRVHEDEIERVKEEK